MKLSLNVFFLLSLLVVLALAKTDPELKTCRHQCKVQRQYGKDEKDRCLQRCEDYYKQKKGKKDEGQEEEEEENPYVFDKDEHFATRARTEHGSIEVLKKFSEKSRLLRGLENYRIDLIEINPQTFVAPDHLDADGVLFVAKGRGTITMIHEDKRESLNIEQGHVIRVKAGTPFYLINRDDNEKLQTAQFYSPVNILGELKGFYPAGAGSFYRTFSWELLEAALKTDRRKLEQILRQNQGAIVKASKEQIQSMSHGSGESSWAFNLLKKSVIKNKFGELFEAKPNEYKQQLQDLDLAVSLANITRGSMAGPFYHSKSTKIAIVLDGEGYFEMAAPHLSGRSEHGSSSQRPSEQGGYEKVSSNLRPGTVFVVPAGHPVATVASGNKNLVILCFEVNAQGSNRYSLAGKNNVVKRLESEAKELAFGVKAREVDEAFKHEEEELFFAGPKGGHRSHGLVDRLFEKTLQSLF